MDFPAKPLSILIPVFNEAPTIREVLARVLAQTAVAQVVVVDDASSDGTSSILHALSVVEPRLSVLRHSKNLGKGAALRTGIPALAAPVTILQDADLEYDPAEYSALAAPILSGQADAVFGSRFIGGQAHRVLYFWHMAGNRLLTLLSNMRTNLNLTDMECGHKAFLTSKLQSLRLRENRFGIEPEFAARAASSSWRLYEVGVSYSGRTYADGKKITWVDGLRALWVIARG
jgi:glycosyltransferase involved in cell wall biosynthesis